MTRKRTLTLSLPSENNLTGTRSPIATANRSRSLILIVIKCRLDHVFGVAVSFERLVRMAGGWSEILPVEKRSM